MRKIKTYNITFLINYENRHKFELKMFVPYKFKGKIQENNLKKIIKLKWTKMKNSQTQKKTQM